MRWFPFYNFHRFLLYWWQLMQQSRNLWHNYWCMYLQCWIHWSRLFRYVRTKSSSSFFTNITVIWLLFFMNWCYFCLKSFSQIRHMAFSPHVLMQYVFLDCSYLKKFSYKFDRGYFFSWIVSTCFFRWAFWQKVCWHEISLCDFSICISTKKG